MRTVRYIRTIIALLILLLYGTGEAWADLSANNDIIIKVMPSETEAKGSVTATEGSVAATVSGRVVTLTVTPGSGYKIRKNLIVVEKMVDPGRLSARRRAPGIGTFDLTGSDGWETGVTSYTFEIPAEYDGAYVTATFVQDEANIITSLDEINDPHGTYKLSRDIDASGLSSSLAEFSGTLDGGIHTIYNLSVPLFSSLDGGTVKNLMLDNVNISGNADGNAGAICGEAKGASRIYNCGVLATGSTIEKDEKGYDKITSCSSTVRGSNYVGGIAGLLDGSSRVINCFSYANITSGNYVGGIVGYNNVATTSANLKTMVMNCMFYGDITGGTNKAPIYNGERILNEGANGVSNFNYFCGEASYVTNKNIDTYNCALMAEARFLQRFEFFRNLLNSHRELAAWWATDDYSKKDEMLKWVLEPSQIGTSTPYPILKTPGKYASVVNIDVNHSETIPTVGTTVGTLGVTIQMGSGAVYSAPTDATITNGSLTLNITDKDPEHFNFNYRKVQLPYYNDVGTKNYTGNRVVTGWKIVEINGGTSGSFTTGADATTNDNGEITASPYNFADRNCTNKDLYSVSHRVFNQGAYWDVPEGVSSIVIEPYWGKAAFLADATPDVVYNAAMTAPVGVPNVAGGTRYTNGNNYTFTDIDGNSLSLKVYTTIANAKNALDNNSARNVYDCAVVLVGNAHNIGISSKEAYRSYTIMSADFDHDNEPDYSYTLRFDGRNEMHPVRVDFLNIPGLGMAQKSATGTGTFNFGIMQPNGWFESTNTSLFRVTQFEYDRENRGEAPLIVQGGVMEQWVSGQTNGVKNTTTYFHVGGNVWFKEFHRGSHQDKDYISKHPPVSVTGGDYAEFYLTGLYRGDIANYQDNAECYINGGRFGTVAGAAQEGIGKTGGADNTGNIVWQIQNADIDEFYGGGLNAAHPVEGNITTVITGGYIKQFCGGPKFGDMNNGKTVKTTANGTQFDTFYGAGYGGNSYSRFAPFNINNINGDYTGWNTFLTNNYKQEYNATYKGVSVTYNTQYLPMSNNNQNVARLLVDFVSFSLARTHGVTSTLTGCTINEDFYGGGNLGKVEGNINSTLQNCTVKGNVYGAGYGGSTPTVEVINTGDFVKAPFYDENLGVYFDPVTPAKVDYRWEHRDETVNSTDRAIDKTNHILYTNEDLTALGTVTGTVTLNINGTTTIGGNVDGGNVYGGGALSDATSDVQVNVNGGEMVNVYGGGKGQSTVVSGDVVVNIGAKDGGGALSGTGSITGDVYGGSAFGAVNATKNPSTGALTYTENKKTDVNIYGGSVTGSVFGGGLGQTTPNVIAAQNFGSTTITMENGTVSTAIYGGANTNGVLKQDATITIIGGTVGTAVDAGAAPADAVFGGGKGEPTLVEGNVTVNIGRAKTGDETENVGTAIIHGNVYGGSALGNTNATKPASDLVFDATKKTNVNLLRGTINGNVFGGGLGQKNGVNSATSDILSYVGGDVKVLLDGAKVTPTYTTGETPTPITGQIFGCNNLNGTPKGHVIVHVKRTEDNDKPTKDSSDNPIDRDTRDTYPYDVAAVYGGGNQADYIPTDATLDPDDDEGNPAKIAAATAEVIIEGCDLTSIEYVYGGGNAAAVPATDVTILGSYIIKYVFGGGNGKSTATFTNPGANIGTYNNGTTIYGTGKATTKLVGGHIIYVFGGSDTKGNVRGGTSITMPETSIYPGYNCCNVRDIKYIYGAGNQAEQDGAVTLVLGCVQNMDYVYGGARKADVKGGVDLVITSGPFKGVFGGNDLSGTIQGPITLTIEETGCDPLEIDNLYLGGNQAAYSVYGYKDDGTGNLVARTSLSDGTAVNPPTTAYSESQLYRDPILNIVSCTRIGKESGDDLGGVFGGGYGAGAIMYGSPTVNVNMIPGKFAERITRTDIYPVSNNENALGIIRNIYGGGEQANVQGNTTVNICTKPTVTVRSSMGAFVTNEPTAVQGALITENVFGAGKGLSTDVNSALVTGNTAVTMAKGSVAKSVYGGGQLSQVGGNTTITVSGGTIGTSGQGGATYGNIYGGGFGDVTDSKFGLVQGNTNITVQNTVANAEYAAAHENVSEGDIISSPSILHNIYGGGAYGSVGTFTFNSSTHETTCAANTGTTNITITGGTIGTDGHENGMVFGASRGDVSAPGGDHDQLAWVDNTIVVIGTSGQGTTLTTPQIKGSVYGGGENGHTYHDASVTIHSGMVGITETMATDPTDQGGALYPYRGNVYGGGCGTDTYKEGNEDKFNPIAGIVQGNTTVLIDGGHVVRDVYGAGAMGSVTGSTNVTIAGNATIGAEGSGGGYVFAAARGENGQPTLATVGSSNLTISGGTVWMDAYGGGQNGYVNGAVTVNLTGGTVKRDVYGGGALAKTNTVAISEGVYPATNVTLTGTTIAGDLYGGGLGSNDVAADVNGPVTVSISGGKAANVFGCNNLNGAPKSTVAVTISGTDAVATGSAIGNVYGGGNQAAYTGSPTVTVSGGTVNQVYGGGLGATAIVNGNTSVTISGTAVIGNDVFGGGSQADVTGSVDVRISGGTVTNDVYGGGALANTNTGNWDGDGSIEYVEVTGLVGETYRVKDDIVEGASVTGLYTYNSSTGQYETATGTAVGGTTYYEKLDGAPVAGYYTESAGVYTKLTTGTANGGTTYYKKKVKGSFVATPPINGTDYYTTTVSLTGGLIGNAYGGGLGNSTTAANVYGDVTISVNKDVTDPTKGVTFVQRIEQVTISGTQYPTPTSGRVFGCNNHNGTPTGDVEVHVYSTRQTDADFNIISGHGSNNRKYQYEIQSVYGGGNQADYLPADGKKSQVIIEGCSDTSIEKVYGGGNSAVIPETDVLIKGAYDIGYAFGGGNGDKPIKKADGTWHENEGAIVIGMAKIVCQGGKIGQVFGGGDAKGSCGNTNAVTSQVGDCPLHITRLYGAGNKGDVAAVNIVLAACSGEAIEYVHGGSYNAHVTGDVHLTITSGILKNVYGGNDARGGIGGNIIVDIEETNGCNPIIIQNLVGGGNEAPYPGTHTVAGEEVAYTTRGNITVNVKSATRIDNIYGGSFMAEANADTEVNINMIKGFKAGKTVTIPKEFSYIPNISNVTDNGNGTITCKINDALGTIGNVYGGGNQGVVKGNTVVNICTSDKVSIMERDPSTASENYGGSIKAVEGGFIDAENGSNIEGKTIKYEDKTALGADIRGNVYGGGNLADVSTYKIDDDTYGGNSTVIICAKKTEGVYGPVAFGVDDVKIGNSVYGGGNEADVLGNTNVRMSGGYVFNGIFGGGYSGSVGTFTTSTLAADADVYGHTAHTGCIGKPISCATGTGKCTVVVDGNTQIGPVTVATQGMPIPQGWVWGGGCGIVEDPATHPDTHFKTYVGSTDVTIGGNAFIMEGIIGGGEFGRVLGNTLVKIEGGQIGVGANQTETVGGVLKPKRYTDAQWTAAATAVTSGDASAINTAAASMPECSHYPYGRNIGTVESPNWVYRPYDPYFKKYNSPAEFAPASTDDPSDGKTWIGVVFGGGSGYMPYEKADGSGYDWCRSAGWVEGDTEVRISGGHILTNVYGGNEYTDVKGTCTVKMTGGTIGVPRTLQQISEHPVTCYLFGAGKGDQRSHFNNMTNVGSVEVEVSGGIVYGSVFGGSEDGHVLGNTNVTIKDGAWIGTWGTSYVDGNIFGGGRGYSGENLSAGTIVGNTEVNIKGGTMLGSIYGGGRMASVGVNFSNAQDPSTGQFIEDETGENSKTYGHVTINVSGGTIGNDTPPADGTYSNSTHSGNVFGGSMGRLTLLNHDPNPLWTRLAQTKSSTINITGGIIKRNVYGGAEFGTTRDNVNITIGSSGTPTINGSVFGGGYGSTIDDASYISNIDAGDTKYLFTPMQYAGIIGGETVVNILGGTVKRNVYGGGEMASVGIIDYSVREDADGDVPYGGKKYSYINAHKHADIHDAGTAGAAGQTAEKVYGFGLSWPYKFSYILGGKTTVNVSGGRIGTAWDDGTGYVFGGGKGHAFERYKEAHIANVRETEVNIKYQTTIDAANKTTGDCVAGAVYGGGEDGHVYENATVNITGGLIGLSVYGGGKGEGTYEGKLRSREAPYAWNNTPKQLPSWTAGKVYGNTSVTMTGGHVLNNVYGGGNLGSVGKGNYAGGTDDYYPAGYGETLTDCLWSDTCTVKSNGYHFQHSGKSTVTITAGTVGTENGTYGTVGGVSSMATPTGMVFGGSRGRAAEDVGALSPRYDFAPDFFLGYANNTEVTIGTRNAATGPTIYSQVFGGGRDGHVRGSAKVEINAGTIGQEYDKAAENAGADADYQRYHRGNVYGSGSGLGTWDNGTHHGQSSGSVTRHTTVDIYGGTIYNNVYGGGAMASVGPPKITMPDYAGKDWSSCTVNIYGGKIGDETDYENHKYGGCVFGASRGGDFATGEKTDDYATTIWNEVNIMPHPTDRTKDAIIAGNVYGGGQASCVKKDNVVNLTGGIIKHDAYGGGKGTDVVAADVGGNTTVELNKNVDSSVKGCILERIFGCNDLNGTPKGHVLVHVYKTQHKAKTKINEKYEKFGDLTTYTTGNYSGLTTLAGTVGANVSTYESILDGSGSEDDKNTALANMIDAIANKKYDVLAVYGGGNLAKYDPTDAHSNNPTLKAAARAEVIIEGCEETSIKQVYGGGNAASTPANTLTVFSAYEINEAFGGGNGKDNYQLSDGKWYENPGANVGYDNFTHYDKSGGQGTGDFATPYKAIVNTSPDATSKEGRQAHYMYGAGEAKTDIIGGRIHYVYGGSNEKGNISTLALSIYDNTIECPVTTDKTYGAGKNAEIDGEVSVTMECVNYTAKHFGGSTNADVNSDVVLNITNGHFDQVFGGNDRSGKIKGSITVNIQESGCKPIVINELYGGGYLAGYSIYGYNSDNSPRTKTQFEAAVKSALTGYESATEEVKKDQLIAAGLWGYPKNDPRVNIISATKIGTIYGGGYQALVVGSPYINVNMEKGIVPAKYADATPADFTPNTTHTKSDEGGSYTYKVESYTTNNPAVLAIGTIGSIYGGGNLADVNGNTSVDIGTGRWISAWDENGNPVWETNNAQGDKFTYRMKKAAITYTEEECNSFNAGLTGAISTSDVAYSFTSYADNNGNTQHGTGKVKQVSQADGWTTVLVTSNTPIDSNAPSFVGQQFKVNATTLNADTYYSLCTTGGAATGIYVRVSSSSYSTDEANAYNATLTGARNTNDIAIPAEWQWYNASQEEVDPPTSTGRNAATITDNVFGGGKGQVTESGDGAFLCATAMVGANGDGLIDANGGTSITIGNGSVGGSVYGGGELGRVEKNTVVTIGLEKNTTNELTIGGNVFGAGKGVATHGYAALVRGNSTVTIQGKTKVGGSVYGGGEIASVGRYNVDADGLPHSLANEKSGNCTVIVRDDAEIGPDNMKMVHSPALEDEKPDDTGHVFGAGMGATPYKDVVGNPYRITPSNTKQEYTNDETYLSYLETLGLATQTNVTISGNAFVKGSVYGGAENGYVQHDTHVTIEGGQIGNGDGVNRRYTNPEWTAGHLIAQDASENTLAATYNNSLPECAHWAYADPYKPHDKFANATEDLDKYSDGTAAHGRRVASDGHTFYGNVFGGGSGYYPYKPGKWHFNAGSVGGNTQVDITGGHILTSVYGGNEMTNIGTGISGTGGRCTVNFGGTATLGVPRTLAEIAAHPVTCYLFGAGKGDQNTLFNKETNVNETVVNVSGGWIYGSVFGGGEDGHVLGNVDMTISGGKIGTWGTSYVDGNVFGGGRGFSGEALTAGVVCGNINMNISGGTMLGSIYGGGRLGSVGTHLVAPEHTTMYGVMIPDGKREKLEEEEDETAAGITHGYITMNISGGTIGNEYEYDYIAPGTTIDDSYRSTNRIPFTEFETNNRLLHTKGGNVFTGGMGRRLGQDGQPMAADWWPKLGAVKNTSLTISGNAKIKSNVYGGGEFGAVKAYTYTDNTDPNNPKTVMQGGNTTINIQGGEIGTEVKDSEGTVKYTFGSVFGGGYGTEEEEESVTSTEGVYHFGALIDGSTSVSMSGGHVWASVLGGGELAAVGGNTEVTISGGEIGKNEVYSATDPYYENGDPNPGYVKFGGSTMGNVYGGGMGKNTNTLLGVVLGNTNVTVEDTFANADYAAAHDGVKVGDVVSSPKIYHNVYGGGALGSVGTFIFSDGVTNTKPYDYMCTVPKGIPLVWTANTGKATVNIKGGTIGISGRDNGMVDGSSRGGIAKPEETVLAVAPEGKTLKDPFDKMAWVESSEVNIGETGTTGPHIKGSVYGGGENGHVFTHATVNMKSGTIGIVDEEDPWYDFGNTEITEKARGTRGNIYGAGCGTDMYDSNNDGIDDTHNAWAGCVIGNTDINISGGLVAQNVYGGGSMGSVGRILEGKDDIVKHDDPDKSFALSWPVKFTYQDLSNNTSTGKATINITGGRIGTTGSDNGDVFGGTRGEAGDRYEMAQFANVRETEVNINYGSTPTDAALEIVENTEEHKFTTRIKDGVEAITGSVYGGSENGHVNEDTHVTLTNGLIGHSIYGGGKGEGQYLGRLLKVGTGKGATPPQDPVYTDPMQIYDWLAGKVYGNTHLTIAGGRVLNNALGGGYMASVGKGNYSGGTDDFYAPGYGETIAGNLWTSTFNPNVEESASNKKDNAWYFLNSGITYVNVFGGEIGSTDVMEGLPAGNIFGGSHGMPAPSLRESYRYLYNPEWLNGYTNETHVTIGGGYKCIQACTDKNSKAHAVGEMMSLYELQVLFAGTSYLDSSNMPVAANWTPINTSAPKIWGSVYGGSQDGRVRRDAHVVVNDGEIGLPYTDANRNLLNMEQKATSITNLTAAQLHAELDNPQWLHRGNVYGAGSGLSKYKFDIDYDGDYDSNAQNGRPNTTYYGVPFKEEDYCQFAGSVIRFTQVDINGGIVHRNVYGGGSMGSVGPPAVPPTRVETAYLPGTTTRDAAYGGGTIGEGWWSQNRVNIKGTIGTPDGYNSTDFKYNPVYGGEVYGASRGEKSVDATQFGTTVWTLVKIKNGATIMNNVFGGGDAGMVKKDSEVIVGD